MLTLEVTCSLTAASAGGYNLTIFETLSIWSAHIDRIDSAVHATGSGAVWSAGMAAEMMAAMVEEISEVAAELRAEMATTAIVLDGEEKAEGEGGQRRRRQKDEYKLEGEDLRQQLRRMQRRRLKSNMSVVVIEDIRKYSRESNKF